MVKVIEVGQFVQEDMILERRGKENQAPVERDPSSLTAGSPSRLLVTDGDAVHLQAVTPRQLQKARGEKVARNPSKQGHRRLLTLPVPSAGQGQADPPSLLFHKIGGFCLRRGPRQLMPASGQGHPGMALEVLAQAQQGRLPGKGPAYPVPVLLQETSSPGNRHPQRQLQDNKPIPLNLYLHPLQPRGAFHSTRHQLRAFLGLQTDQVKGSLWLLQFHG
mgnify:CR=1 FL=1